MALAYLHREFAEGGFEVDVADGDSLERAIVIA
jgi:hypothetical protein